MRILDVSAGNRAIWFDKANPLCTYVDIRPEVEPDIVADCTALPADIGTGFSLVVFDPSHKNNAGGNMVRNYGAWTHEQIRHTIEGTAREAHRVAVADALMAFKWNDHSIKLATVLELMAPYWQPLFGHGVTHQQKGTFWVMLRRAGFPWEKRQ